jgi:hypothetical protein
MALFITLGLISRPSAKMLSLAQHPDYAQHLSVYAVSCTVSTIHCIRGCLQLTENSANYVWYCTSGAIINNFTIKYMADEI